MSFFNLPNNNTTGTAPTGGLFGNNNAAAGTSGTGNAPQSNIFGGINTGLGAKPATSAPGGSAFGGGSTTGLGGLFGGATTATSAPAPSGGLFGGGNTTSTAPALAPSTGGLFGGGATNTSSAAPSGGLFGGGAASGSNPAPATTNPLFAGGGLFGSGGSSFSLPKPTDQAAAPAFKPPPSNFFAQPSTTAAPSTGSTPAPSGGLFGNLPSKPAEATTTPSTTTAPTTNPLLAGFFNKPATTPTTSTTTPTAPKDSTAATGLAGLFGPAKPAEKKDSTPAPAAPSPFGLFGEKKDASSAEKPKDATTPVATNVASTAPIVAVPPPSALRGKTIEEIVNKWSSDLEVHVREFNRYASEVAVWDRALIENGNNLAALFSHVQAAEREQHDIEQSLDHIEQQQAVLAATLDSYEKSANEILGGSQGGGSRVMDTGPADTERDKNYMLATDLHTHLDDLSGSLTQMIESVNSLSLPSAPAESTGTNGEDAMAQIAQILSSHLESLQWIDGAVREVENKVTDVEKRVNDSGLSTPNQKSRGFGVNR